MLQTTDNVSRFFSPTPDQIHVNQTDKAEQAERATRAIAAIKELAERDYRAAVSYGDLLIDELRTSPPAQQAAVVGVLGIHVAHIKENPDAFHDYASFVMQKITHNKPAQELVVESALEFYGMMARLPFPLGDHFRHASPAERDSRCISTGSNLAIVSNALAALTANTAWNPSLQAIIVPHTIRMNNQLAKTEPETASLLANKLVFAVNRNPPMLADAANAAMALHQALPHPAGEAATRAKDELAIAAAPLLVDYDLDRYTFRANGSRSLEPWGAQLRIAVLNKATQQINYGDFNGTLETAAKAAADLKNPATLHRAGYFLYSETIGQMAELMTPVVAAHRAPDTNRPGLAEALAGFTGPGRPRALSQLEEFVGTELPRNPRFMDALSGAGRSLDEQGVALTVRAAVAKQAPQP